MNKITLSFFDILNILIFLISFYSLILLSLGRFNVDVVLIVSGVSFLLLSFFSRYFYQVPVNILSNRHVLSIFVLLVVASCFRYAPYLYVVGGQDEGVYVNMSKVYETEGSVFQTDGVRKNIHDDVVLSIYDKENQSLKTTGVAGKFEGGYLPGVYVSNNEWSERVFQFYHLHPLWMSIAGKVLGDQNRVYSLVFFSLISIVAFYLLAYEYTGSRLTAFITSLLLAINPLHAFFSKFPVTEVMALAFSSTGFYYLLKFYSLSKRQYYYPVYLILSALAIAAMFFTRISGFLYLPFFFVLVVLSRLYISDGKTKSMLLIYFVFIFCFYLLSVFYGLSFSYPYSTDIYNNSFARLFGENWHEKLFISLIPPVFLLIVILFKPESKFIQGLKKINSKLLSLAPYLFIFVISMGLFKVYQLGFTDKYIDSSWFAKTFPMAGREWISVFYSSLIVALEYLSPFIALLLFISLFRFRYQKRNFDVNVVLIIFLFGFCIYIALLQWTVPYHYYYARYLLTEVVPYSLLFAMTISFGKGRTSFGNNASTYAVILSGVYFLFFSVHQFKGKEMDGAYDSLKNISDRIESNSLIFINKSFGYREAMFKTPLVYYFGKNVFSFSTQEQLDVLSRSSDIKAQYNKLYVFSNAVHESDIYSNVEQFQYRQGNFAKSGVIPRDFSYQEIPIYLYQLKTE